jgi:glucose/arabinose dehydrogenase
MENDMKIVARLAVSIGFALIVGLALPIRVSAQGPSDNVTVFARDLNNPRGLKFGPDGNLYVAEGGKGDRGDMRPSARLRPLHRRVHGANIQD